MSQGKYRHLTSAPKRLLDVDYCIKVAKGEVPPSRYALTVMWEDKFVPADEIPDHENAYGHGYEQGWHCEMGGRAFITSPPPGLPVNLLPSFCEGVLSGSENVRRAREASSHGGESEIAFDPFADLDDHSL